ncbi:swi5-like zinc finger protein [Mortierella alpina]|uniref:Swi5-like zinc finger protein n=1 Tax=Mortierella alpina TaxID=64518 RepID=A0A9P6IUB6_MORAP|nr:swi5-like zinc finger protein [Mortierella alpina]
MDPDTSLLSTPSSPQDRRTSTDNDNDNIFPVDNSDDEFNYKRADDPNSRSREPQRTTNAPSEAANEESGTSASKVASSPGTTADSTPDIVASTAASHDRQVKRKESKEQYDMMKAREDAKITQLKATIVELERQEQELLHSIRGEGTPSEIIDRHIEELHRYNEIKDAGQIILGKCAEVEGTTIKGQYEKYGLDIED